MANVCCNVPTCRCAIPKHCDCNKPETKLWARNRRTGLWDLLRTCFAENAEEWKKVFLKDPSLGLTYYEIKISKNRPSYKHHGEAIPKPAGYERIVPDGIV